MPETTPAVEEQEHSDRRGFFGFHVLLITLAVVVLTAGGVFFAIRIYLFPSELTPATLSVAEEQRLEQKLQRLGVQWESASRNSAADSAVDSMGNTRALGAVEPEAYSESDADRELVFSEKEVNALIGGNSDFARRVAIDFSDDLASAQILVPVPPDFPVMPGRIVRVNAGVSVWLDDLGRLAIALRGVSVMGVPVPNAWLGNLKNVDLVDAYGDGGFWKAFADGVEDLQIREGKLYMKLRE